MNRAAAPSVGLPPCPIDGGPLTLTPDDPEEPTACSLVHCASCDFNIVMMWYTARDLTQCLLGRRPDLTPLGILQEGAQIALGEVGDMAIRTARDFEALTRQRDQAQSAYIKLQDQWHHDQLAVAELRHGFHRATRWYAPLLGRTPEELQADPF